MCQKNLHKVDILLVPNSISISLMETCTEVSQIVKVEANPVRIRRVHIDFFKVKLMA